MHFLILFALAGVCLIVGPIVIEVGLRIALGALGVALLAVAVAVIHDHPWIGAVLFAVVLVAFMCYRIDQRLERRHRRLIAEEEERQRLEAERPIRQRVENVVAIWRSATGR